MAIVRFNPFVPTVGFNRLNTLDKFFADVLNAPVFNDDFSARHTTPSVNVVENAEAFRLEVAAPGLAKEDFKVSIDDKTLTISAEKTTENKTEGDTKEEKYVRREFGYASFKRQFTLPENVNAADIKATYDNGVLHVTLPKHEAKKLVQTIEIQ